MSTCTDPETCGHPQNGAGRPRKGWVKVHIAGHPIADTWWCSTTCAAAGLAGVAGRLDVATCPACINRHDRGHRCSVCNTVPHLIAGAPVPTRLYDNARRGIEQHTRKEPA